MRRLTILLATVAALMLVPASQAFGNETVTVEILGEGSGKIEPGSTLMKGTPPIECSYNGETEEQSGTCEAELSSFGPEGETEAIFLKAVPGAGDALLGWEVEGATFIAFCTNPLAEKCQATQPTGAGGGIQITAYFGPGIPLTVEHTGTGSGETKCTNNLATGSGAFGTCREAYPEGAKVRIEPTAAEGSIFKGWTGCDEIVFSTQCGITMTEARTVSAEFEAEAPPGPELTVVKEGTGEGTVVSSPAGLECGATCSSTAFEEGSKVTLTASPAAGSLFVSWKGCEKGGVNGRQCTVTMDKAKTVNAKFVTAYDVTVNRVGSGLGKVSSSPGGVLCLSNCSSTTAAFKEGTSVTLTAAPSKNYVFTEWTGDCSGAGPCALGSLGEDKEVGAKFTEVAKHLLTVTKSGGGQGTAKSNVAGINCGATCSSMASAYYQGTVVELTATPGKGSSFGGWSGSGCSGTGTCTVTMSEAKAVTAEFK